MRKYRKVDPYTINECMHTFCRTCILNYFLHFVERPYRCPRCKINLHPSDFKRCLQPDRQMGEVLHALLPGLEQDETLNEKHFYESSLSSSSIQIIPKELRLKLRLNKNRLKTFRYIDSLGNVHIRQQQNLDENNTRYIAVKSTTNTTEHEPTSTATIIPRKFLHTRPFCLQIELCKKYVDPELINYFKNGFNTFLLINSQLKVEHIRKYLESVFNVSPPIYNIYLYFYESCLNESTKLLMIKKMLFPTTDRIKLHFVIVKNQDISTTLN
ncbi:unnamed protein product [Didymodactylos carnosus]|uniref:RING-type domain-containing protein n=1 Tax=Didymodactylos carnosus TaxID=1234261 RepID=A0A814FPH7_9BILA|nr:unnamed protein product [Didymodactylos carnosus]CAF0984875.1 unnamed protein product [Didymodactylos carnosus]CAF3631164.1 unnamed protein product [Didymodactylos carnosus]CAF3757154.1 unnamed protein product [Didymodactylos carnosus]